MGDLAPPEPGGPLEELLGALLTPDRVRAQRIVDRTLREGWSADDVRFELITPALRVVGERWERGEIGVGLEHLASSICQWLVIDLAGRTARVPASGRRAVVGCSEGELHALGALMAANVLTEHGWTVLYLGASTPATAWAPIVSSRHADVAVIATTLPSGLEHVGPTIAAIRAARPGCLIVVGGAAYAAAPGAVQEVGADLAVMEARGLPDELEALQA